MDRLIGGMSDPIYSAMPAPPAAQQRCSRCPRVARRRLCQVVRRRALFSLIEPTVSHSQQAHVTTSHSTNARVRSRR